MPSQLLLTRWREEGNTHTNKVCALMGDTSIDFNMYLQLYSRVL